MILRIMFIAWVALGCTLCAYAQSYDPIPVEKELCLTLDNARQTAELQKVRAGGGYPVLTEDWGTEYPSIIIGTHEFAHGFSVWIASDVNISWELDGNYRWFTAWVGVEDCYANGKSGCVVEILADGQSIYKSSRLTAPMSPEPVCLSVEGMKVLTISLSDNARLNGSICEPRVHAQKEKPLPAVLPPAGRMVELTGEAPAPEGAWTLWYRKPARYYSWESLKCEGLPLGNGSLAALVCGGVLRERIQFNERTLWTGGPRGRFADSFQCKAGVREPVSVSYGRYTSMGDVLIDFPGIEKALNYRRVLDLEKSMVTIEYISDGIQYKREYFISYPDQAMVLRMSASQPGSISCDLSLHSPHLCSAKVSGDLLHMSGALKQNGMAFSCRIQARPEGGRLESAEDHLIIREADAVTVMMTAATDYSPDFPDHLGRAPGHVTEDRLKKLMGKRFEDLRAVHVKDVTALFDRAILWMPANGQTDVLPTNERIATARSRVGPGVTPNLRALYFQFARYLLIAGSRKGALAMPYSPWSPFTTPRWAGVYKININTEEEYWITDVGNLAECFEPLWTFVEQIIVPPGRRLAAGDGLRGFYIHYGCNVFGDTQGNDRWKTGIAWLTHHGWEYFQFTQDKEMLRDRIYPLLKGSSEYFFDYMVEDGRDGKLVVPKGFSPEHSPMIDPKDKPNYDSNGVAMDQQIVWTLLDNAANAADVLGVDREFAREARATRDRLSPPIKIGRYGQIQEWYQDLDNPQDNHRHISHMWAVYPGNMVVPSQHPEWARAAAVSMNMREGVFGDKDFDGSVGKPQGNEWTHGWKTAIFARLLNAERAWSYGVAIPGVALDNLFLTEGNIISVDGVCAIAQGTAEMLLQSHAGFIHLLPALPRAWPEGKIAGFAARGGFQVDMQWRDGNLIEATIHSKVGNPCRVMYRGRMIELELKAGEDMCITAKMSL